MKRERGHPPRAVRITRVAGNSGAGFATAAFPLETGGILLGWRTDNAIHVVDLVEVRDPGAGPNSYERHHQIADSALTDALTMLPPDTAVGYVGEWHTHGTPLRHSWQDRRELRVISQLAEHPVALIVLARRRRGAWTPHALTAQHGTVRRAEVVEENPQ